MGKICTKCGQYKELDQYHKNKTRKLGYSVWCKACTSITRNIYYKKNKEVRRKYSNEYDKKNRKTRKKYKKSYTERLRDGYVIDILMKIYEIKKKDISKDMINIKRKMILAKRLIRLKKQQIKTTGGA